MVAGADAARGNPLDAVAPLQPDDVPVRNRLVLVVGIGLVALTILAMVVAMIVALGR